VIFNQFLVVYKCITEILANRLMLGLNSIVISNQIAFIPRQSVFENILFAQELVRDYHKEKVKA
jgi:hypothetical protein